MEFVEIRRRYEGGSPAAVADYVYLVDGQEVFVEVDATVTNRWNGPQDTQVSEGEVKQAAEYLIETDLRKGWSPQKSNRLTLDEDRIKPIALKLGWTARE
jgi:hypothetical protein